MPERGRHRFRQLVGHKIGKDDLNVSSQGQTEAAYIKVWQDDPRQKGGFAFLQPNELASIWPAARRAEGRVHFAGEHTSPWFGWQNGGLESAECCVDEILAAAG